MTHEEIHTKEIAEAYVRGRLSDEERTAFEAHYFGCDECFEQVQALEKFVAGMKDAAESGVLPEVRHAAGANWLRPAFWPYERRLTKAWPSSPEAVARASPRISTKSCYVCVVTISILGLPRRCGIRCGALAVANLPIVSMRSYQPSLKNIRPSPFSRIKERIPTQLLGLRKVKRRTWIMLS